MKRFLLSAVMLFSGSCANDSLGQQKGVKIVPVLINDVEQSFVKMHAATPFMDKSSVVVVDIDVTKIDVGKAVQWFFRQSGLPENDEQAVQAIATATGLVESAKGAGVSHLYLTAGPQAFLDGGPLVVIPCDNTAVVSALASVVTAGLPKKRPQAIHVGEKLVLIGPQSAIDRALESEGAERPDLLLPMKNADRLDHHAVFTLPQEFREDLIALWPDKTPEAAPLQFSPRELVRDIRRVVLTLRLPPREEVVATIETRDELAAERVQSTVKQALALSDAGDAVSVEGVRSNVIVRATPDSLAAVATAVTAPMKKRASHVQTMNRMKRIGLAMHNYFSVNNHLPPRYLTDREGTPLLSWRVTILPYIEQLALHREFQLDQPWDKQAKANLKQIVVPTYSDGGPQPWKTRIRVPVYPGSLWHGEGPPHTIRDVQDGTANTIAAIHAPVDKAIEWARPESWVLSEKDPASDVFGDRDLVTVLLVDGSVRVFTRQELTNEKLKAMLTINGGEVIEW